MEAIDLAALGDDEKKVVAGLAYAGACKHAEQRDPAAGGRP